MAVISYVLVRGVDNILRHYYMKDIERRLFELNDEEESYSNKEFLHWREYITPIVTRNPKHIGSYHTILYYVLLSSTLFFCILFCLSIIVMLFLRIRNMIIFDYLVCAISVVFIIGVLVYFFVASLDAEKMVDYARQTAYLNRRDAQYNHYSISTSYYRNIKKKW